MTSCTPLEIFKSAGGVGGMVATTLSIGSAFVLALPLGTASVARAGEVGLSLVAAGAPALGSPKETTAFVETIAAAASLSLEDWTASASHPRNQRLPQSSPIARIRFMFRVFMVRLEKWRRGIIPRLNSVYCLSPRNLTFMSDFTRPSPG